MNLHNAVFGLRTVGIWLTAWGANGRQIGIHIWPVDEGTAPAPDPNHPETRPTWQRYGFWSPSRFGWSPFDFSRIFRGGYTPPLCGHRSASRRPRISEARYVATHNMCAPCLREATRRGIVVLSHEEAMSQSTQRQELLMERERWQAAGSPNTWPLPTA